MTSTSKRIRTVLYDDQNISRSELELLHTHTFQRLYGLHQLGLADRVFIDASHSRLHHVVGVLAQVEKLVSAVVSNLQRTPSSEITYDAGTTTETINARDLAEAVDKARPIARLIGFLHDLTHAPYGHTVEDEIELMATKHDDPERQAEAYYRLLVELVGWLATDLGAKPDNAIPVALARYLSDPELAELPTVDDVSDLAAMMLSLEPSKTRLFWRLRPDEVLELLAQLNVAMTALLHLEVLHASVLKRKLFPADEYPFQNLIHKIFQKTGKEALLQRFKFVPRRDAYLLDIVGNTVCADILDYAQRDAYYANLKLSYDADRIAENFTLVSWNASAYYLHVAGAEKRECPENCADPFSGSSIRAAISLFSHKLRTDVPGELMNLLNVRFYLYERAIYHPTKSAAGAMLGTALQLLGWNRQADDTSDILPRWLRFVGDDVFMFMIHRAAHLALSKLGADHGSDTLASPAVTEEGSSELRLAFAIVQANRGPDGENNERRVSRVTETKANITAAIGLLDRLRARRFVRPVFRALPNVRAANLEVSAAIMAAKFKQPAARFDTERLIELGADLPRGTITIHCPRENTAEKIANVLLVLPPIPTDKGNTSSKIRRLCHIDSILDGVFTAHAKAIHGVQEMYKSMWRLAVYVAPEHFDHWEEIERVAGKCLFESLAGRPQANQHEILPNDDMLRYEIQLRMHETETQEVPEREHLRIEELTVELATLINQANSGTLDPQAVERDVAALFDKYTRVLPALRRERFQRFHNEATIPYFADEAPRARVLVEPSIGDALLGFDSIEFETLMSNIQRSVAASDEAVRLASQPLFRIGEEFTKRVSEFVVQIKSVINPSQGTN